MIPYQWIIWSQGKGVARYGRYFARAIMDRGHPARLCGAARFRSAVAGGKTNFMTVWEHERGSTTIWDIHSRLISPYTILAPAIYGRR